jgi:uncharacterized membrane protein YphA (DoxX/SURF4 family)
MALFKLILQTVIALGIMNVWLLRSGRASPWRGGSATTMKEEFAAYGLPPGAMYLVGCLKLLCALCLLAGIWLPAVTTPAAAGVALLMAGAIAMHCKIGDPLKKSLPAATLLLLSLLVIAL